jgi:hypothetical protein
MLIRLLGLGALIFLFSKGMNLGKEQLNFIMNLTESTLASSEVKNISRMIYTNLVMYNDYTLPEKSDDEWREYIRTNSHSDVEQRDTSKDMFGTPYRVRALDSVPGRGGGKGYEVRSAGPDKEFGTDDDIAATRLLD